ncbi:hypothetical protein GUITHDRAFT_140672 [Guillardia theta CCMP2712]|uniref:Uncharacterized protein n=1 Tax=Guillardia theta (strain CCMP2712) TaxID=905079 RepID=L1J4R0_GUITC|nr:hypothetical protein GUITHDRAFT_140672 [Guillardia theta CCMP2712]EKX43080.1 hypothetical protein GUITHDRAFT_140672 [Guillardia theta CCMP2712]|eukprot:XP_005830060.1 hypothetical protein GUITHDRAFT_140672 [Guillardia theta CCMP2712]
MEVTQCHRPLASFTPSTTPTCQSSVTDGAGASALTSCRQSRKTPTHPGPLKGSRRVKEHCSMLPPSAVESPLEPSSLSRPFTAASAAAVKGSGSCYSGRKRGATIGDVLHDGALHDVMHNEDVQVAGAHWGIMELRAEGRDEEHLKDTANMPGRTTSEADAWTCAISTIPA